MAKIVIINGERYRIIRRTRKKRFSNKTESGYQLQNYGKKFRGKAKQWLNVIGGFKKTMAKMNAYVKNLRSY